MVRLSLNVVRAVQSHLRVVPIDAGNVENASGLSIVNRFPMARITILLTLLFTLELPIVRLIRRRHMPVRSLYPQ